MRLDSKAVLIVALWLTAATLLFAGVALASGTPQRQALVVPTGLVLASLMGLASGLALARRRGRYAPLPVAHTSESITSAHPAPGGENSGEQSGDGTGTMSPTSLDEQTFAIFARELLAANSTDAVRGVIDRHLPTLLATRQLWISSQLVDQKQVIFPVDGDGHEPPAVAKSVEWTTFPLQIDGDTVGALSVHHGDALAPPIQRKVQLITPLIAQALSTAHTIETLRETSSVDLLTGAATRREGLARLQAEIKRAQRTGHSMAVLMLDLDRFKSINDRFGHPVGDLLLSKVGQTLTQTLRATDIRCRWGGEEFVIVLPETDLSRAHIVAAGLCRNIASATIETPTGTISSTVSIGLTLALPDESSGDAIIQRADTALYTAKEQGRDCVRALLGSGSEHRREVAPSRPFRTSASTALPFRDRRHPGLDDRRNVPSPGRRRTDPHVAFG